ncbi:MAG: ABC transporter substrate-binding protein [Bacilli bacterium]
MKIKNILLIPMMLFSLASCNNNDNKITIAEVTHSLFYAPLYIAKNAGFFNDVGLDIDIVTTPGADKVMASLLSKDAQIGLMGPEASVYVYNNGQENYAINFAQLTQKDGSFLLGREKIDNFDYSMLKGKTIIGGRKGGMPEMTLEHVLKKNGLTITQNGKDKNADVNIRVDVSFDATSGVFVAGESDYVTAFEPTASQIEATKKGYIVSSIGKDSGIVPYTCFSSVKSYFEGNKDKLKKFTTAIKKGLDYINNTETNKIIEYLKPSFQTSKDDEIESVINNYKKIEAWPNKLGFTKDNFNKLIDIVKEAGELDKDTKIPYDKIVTNEMIN